MGFGTDAICSECAASGASLRFHGADNPECALPECHTAHFHRSCDSCGHEWAEPPPHLRKRDYPDWAKAMDDKAMDT
jgi:hypothetical protein